MTWKLYVVPLTGTGTRSDPRRPAYLQAAGVTETAIFDYGASPWALLAADTDPTQEATLTSHTDVRALPTTLDDGIGPALATVVAYLESAAIPAEWLASDTTWRTLLRSVSGLFQFAGRYAVLNNGDLLVVNPAALDLRFNQLTQARRTALSAVAADLGYDTSAITGTTLLRQALRILALQWIDRPFTLGRVTY